MSMRETDCIDTKVLEQALRIADCQLPTGKEGRWARGEVSKVAETKEGGFSGQGQAKIEADLAVQCHDTRMRLEIS